MPLRPIKVSCGSPLSRVPAGVATRNCRPRFDLVETIEVRLNLLSPTAFAALVNDRLFRSAGKSRLPALAKHPLKLGAPDLAAERGLNREKTRRTSSLAPERQPMRFL